MKNYFKSITLGIFLTCFCCASIHSQQALDELNRVSVELSDGITLNLIGAARRLDDRFSGDYYYLPTNLRLSRTKDGTPEFLFVRYTKDAADGGQGGIIHFLTEWGLTPQQINEAQGKLKTKLQSLKGTNSKFSSAASNPKILGPVKVTPHGDKSFRIISATLNGGNAKIVKSGMAPPVAGAKAAVAAKMDKEEAQLLLTTLDKRSAIADLTVDLTYQYYTLTPSVDGNITIYWNKIEKYIEENSADFTSSRKRGRKSDKKARFTYSEASDIYEEVRKNKFIDVRIDENVPSETSKKVIDAFLNVFIEAISDLDMEGNPPPPSAQESEGIPNIKYGKSYTYNQSKAKRRYETGKQVYNLKYRMSVPNFIPVTGTLGEWYKGVRNNKKCVYSVNLSDPFWDRREIEILVGLNGKALFDQGGMTKVETMLKKSPSNKALDGISFNYESIKNGVSKHVPFAREGNSEEKYMYKTRWHFNDGTTYEYPGNNQYKEGDWTGVVLAPPLKPIKIVFDSDIDTLKQYKIGNATLQLRYYRFGEEHHKNISLTASRNEPVLDDMIFMDNKLSGLAYRLVLTHKDRSIGRLATSWQSETGISNEFYVYASLPKEVKEGKDAGLRKLKEAFKLLLGDGEVKDLNKKILKNFPELLDLFMDGN